MPNHIVIRAVCRDLVCPVTKAAIKLIEDPANNLLVIMKDEIYETTLSGDKPR
jgi:hypothetical protein